MVQISANAPVRDHVVGGYGYAVIPPLPGLVFRRLTLEEKSAASRAYSSFLKEDMKAGGRFSEPLLPTELRRRCLEVGLDYDELMAKEEEFQKRIFEQAPADLRESSPLTYEQMQALPGDQREAYLVKLRDRIQRIKGFLGGLFTPEEVIIRAQIEQVKELRSQLALQTYEHHARIRQRLVEILYGARQEGNEAQPYFTSLEQLYELEDRNHDAWVLLAGKWQEFRAGLWPESKSVETPRPDVM